MNIVWAKVGGIWPVDRGGRRRTFEIVNALAERHELTVVTTHTSDDEADGLRRALPGCRTISVPWRIPKRGSREFAVALARSWLSPLPVDLWRCQVPELRRRVAALAPHADVCVSDFLAAAPNVPLAGPVPVVLFEHNVEHQIWRRLAAVERRPWRRALLELEWRKLRRYEASVVRRVRRTIAVSEADRAQLAAGASGAEVTAIPTGVDTEYFHPNGRAERPRELVFVGAMDWYPNEDAVLQFAGTILPRIRREVPDVELTVVGRNPGPRLADLGPGVRVTGTVDDVRPFLDEAAVVVVPLRVGGGTRLKIFEALAMARPVVSTTIGAEGVPLVPGEHVVLADEADAFARAVVDLLGDAARRRALGARGRRLVETEYGWASVARAFEHELEEVRR